jgi:pyrroline-5-carboxylate reductase
VTVTIRRVAGYLGEGATTALSLLTAVIAMGDPTRYGFVGVVTMASAIVRGLCTLDDKPASIVLSPRGAQKSKALAEEYSAVCRIAASNQEVLDSCDVVFIGVLPAQTEEVCRALKFESRHTVVSLVSTAPLSLLQECCAPVPSGQVVRAIPLPPVQHHKGPCVMTPPHPKIVALFDSLGTCVAVESEALMKKMMPMTCLMGQLYKQQLAAQQWLVANGVGASSAAKWVGAVYHGVSYDSAVASEHTFEHLVAEQTPGGLNEQILREMTEAGTYSALHDSLDGALARIEGRPATKKRKNPYSSSAEE